MRRWRTLPSAGGRQDCGRCRHCARATPASRIRQRRCYRQGVFRHRSPTIGSMPPCRPLRGYWDPAARGRHCRARQSRTARSGSAVHRCACKNTAHHALRAPRIARGSRVSSVAGECCPVRGWCRGIRRSAGFVSLPTRVSRGNRYPQASDKDRPPSRRAACPPDRLFLFPDISIVHRAAVCQETLVA